MTNQSELGMNFQGEMRCVNVWREVPPSGTGATFNGFSSQCLLQQIVVCTNDIRRRAYATFLLYMLHFLFFLPDYKEPMQLLYRSGNFHLRISELYLRLCCKNRVEIRH
jgi:hypothetical protein